MPLVQSVWNGTPVPARFLHPYLCSVFIGGLGTLLWVGVKTPPPALRSLPPFFISCDFPLPLAAGPVGLPRLTCLPFLSLTH